MAEVHTYDLEAVTVSIAGILVSEGGGDDGFLTITFAEGFGSKAGVHGDVVTYKMGTDAVAEGTLTLLDPSPSNQSLFALYQADKLSITGAGVGDFILEDLNSNLEITGKCRLTKRPDVSKAAESGSFEWGFQIYQPTVNYRPRVVIVP
jgi:hypothetical protein